MFALNTQFGSPSMASFPSQFSPSMGQPMVGGFAPQGCGCDPGQQQRIMMMRMLQMMESMLQMFSTMLGGGAGNGMGDAMGFPGMQGGAPFGGGGSPFGGGGSPFGGGGSPFGGPMPGGPNGGVPGANGMAPGIGQADPELVSKLPASMKHLAPVFQDAGQKYGIDPKFLAAISMLETGKGTSSAFRNKNNAMGVSDRRGPISFSNPAESIYRMAKTLANPKGPYARANTIQGIGRIYAPPGAGNDPNGTNGYWATGVGKYYSQLGGNPSQAVLRR